MSDSREGGLMARTKSGGPALPAAPGGAGAEVADEPPEVITQSAAIDMAKASGMVCTRVPHESRAGRRVQRVWQAGAVHAEVVALMDHLVCEGIERLVLESTSDYWRI
jgi:transposase